MAACLVAFATLMAASLVTRGFGHERAADTFSRHLAVHCILHFARRDDLADFHVGHFDAPAFGHFIQTGAQHVVDMFAF